MDIDLAALRALERERDISLDVLIPAIEQALLVAYHRTDGSHRDARVELDRKTGHDIVWAREEGELLPAADLDTTPRVMVRVTAVSGECSCSVTTSYAPKMSGAKGHARKVDRHLSPEMFMELTDRRMSRSLYPASGVTVDEGSALPHCGSGAFSKANR